MSTTTFQTQPSLFALNTPVSFNTPTLSPSSTPPKQSSDYDSNSGLASKTLSSEEASSSSCESAIAPPEHVPSYSPPGSLIPSVANGPTALGHAFLSPIRFMRPPPRPFVDCFMAKEMANAENVPAYMCRNWTTHLSSSPNLPPPSSNPSASSTPNTLPQTNGNLQAPSPPNAVIPGIPPNGSAIGASAPGQANDLFVHVEQGETISLAVGGNEIQQITGPATVRLVGHVNSPLPLHVPLGHSISQIVDEKGILRHLILSPQNAVNLPPSNVSGITSPLSHHLPQGVNAKVPTTTAPSVSQPSSATTPVTNTGGHSPPKSASPPMNPSYPPFHGAPVPNSSNAENQTFTQRKRFAANSKRNGNQTPSETTYNGTMQENNTNQLTIDQEEREQLLEALNRIHQPTVTRIGSQDADIYWLELDTSEAAASGGPFPQIDASEYTYELFLYEGSPPPNGRLLTQKECPPLSSYNGVRLTRLKPSNDYFVAVRASLPERQLIGSQSPTVHFQTRKCCVPDAPQYLRFTQKGSNFLSFSWVCPSNNGGSPVIGYVLQITKGRSFETVYEGPAEQARISRLDPGTSYKARVAAENDVGRSEFTPPLITSTTVAVQHPQAIPVTAASLYYSPLQAGLAAGIHPAYGQQAAAPSQNLPSKIPAPVYHSASARGARLSWQPSAEFPNLTLEYADTSRPYSFTPITPDLYSNSRLGANVTGLKSNREYKFRLVGTSASGEIARSDYTIVRTHKDRYENSNFYQPYQGGSEKERLPTPTLHKTHEDDSIIELSWKLPGFDHETVTYVLEGSNSFTNSNNYLDNNSNDWKLCYKGPETSYKVRDLYLVAFRVQAFNKRNASSLWSETCFARRTSGHRSKRQTQSYGQNSRSQYHSQTYSNQQYNNSQRQSSPPAQKADALVQQITEAVEATPPTPIKAPNCTVPKLTNITQSSIEISWKSPSVDTNDANKHSLIYELQRVDKQALIIYSGNETHFQLGNLRPVEHVQVRARSVILDYEGQRTEGDWSSIGSGITLAAVTSPPQNLRLKSEHSPFTLTWDAPAQMNGSAVIDYLVESANFAMEENKPIDSLTLQQLASTERLEYSIETLLPAHLYIFTVVSRNEAGKSMPSERLEFTSPATSPSPPIQLHLEANSFKSLHATWLPSASNGAIVEAYKLILYHEKTIVAQDTVSHETLEYLFTSLDAEKLYTLEAQAKNNVGWGKGARVTCSTLQVPPDPPHLSLMQATANTLKLKWSPSGSSNDELLYYYLERENENGKFGIVYEGENHSAKVKGLRESTSHRFRIRASRYKATPSLAGHWSPLFTAQTTRQPPVGIRSAPSISEVQPGLLQVDWQSYNKSSRDSSGGDESASKNTYYKLQTSPKNNKGSDSWKTVYEGSSTSCAVNISNCTNSTLPTVRQYRVLVVQKHEDNEEVLSLPSPVALFNTQRTPTDSPRKRSVKPTSGQSTPSSLVSGRSASNTVNARASSSSTQQPVRVVPSHKLSLYKRFKRFLLKRSINERDGAFIVLATFVGIAIVIAVFLNSYYEF